jgi:hypothetical protein
MTPMTTRHFPVLLTPAEWKRYPDCPRSIPWHLVALHEPQAWQNHRQSLATLARRGGLDPTEMRAVLEGKRHGPPADRDAEMAAAVEYLKDLISQPERPHPMQPHDLDQLSRDIAHHIHGQAPQGAAASTVAPDQLAAQIRWRRSKEAVQLRRVHRQHQQDPAAHHDAHRRVRGAEDPADHDPDADQPHAHADTRAGRSLTPTMQATPRHPPSAIRPEIPPHVSR